MLVCLKFALCTQWERWREGERETEQSNLNLLASTLREIHSNCTLLVLHFAHFNFIFLIAFSFCANFQLLYVLFPLPSFSLPSLSALATDKTQTRQKFNFRGYFGWRNLRRISFVNSAKWQQDIDAACSLRPHLPHSSCILLQHCLSIPKLSTLPHPALLMCPSWATFH